MKRKKLITWREHEKNLKTAKLARTFGLIYSFLMAWFLNSLALSMGLAILGFFVIFVFYVALLVYLDFCEILSKKLAQTDVKKPRKKSRKKKR